MYEFFMWLIAVPIAIAVVLGSFIGLGYTILRLIALFSTRMQHPKLGEISYFWGVWQASGSAIGEKDISFHIPGDRTGPSEDAVELIDRVKKAWPDLELEFLTRFAEEILESDYPEMYPDIPAAAERKDMARLKKLTHLSEISVEKSPKGDDMLAYLGFLHDWDPEHTRSFVVNKNLKVVDYGLTVGM